MTLEERYNRKRTPVVPRPELATTPLAEPEIAGSRNPVAQPAGNTSGSALISPDEPQLSQYQWNQRFYDEYMTPPMTSEEEERRKRAASAVTGIGHLGNVLSAFSNLIFAGEAPSQKIPTVADPGLRSFSDRIMDERRKYASGRLAAINTDINNYQRALQLYRQDQARKNELEYRRAALDRQSERDRWDKEKWEKEYESNKAYRDWQKGIEETRVGLQERALDMRENGTYSGSSTSGSKSVSSGKNGLIVLETPEGFMDVDMSRMNIYTLSQMYNSLPENIRKKYRISSRDSEKDIQSKYMSAIGEAANTYPGVADYLYRSGTGKLREGTKSDVTNYLPQRLRGGDADIEDYDPSKRNN